jgi:putative ABC transport system permease protein
MSWIGEMWRRMAMLVRRGEFQRELDEEMQLHREMRESELLASGVGKQDAQHAASRMFGNATSLGERGREVWGWRWLEDFVQDLRFGVRMLRKNAGFTIVVVVTLALGIGANTAIFSVVKGVLMNKLPYREPERLVTLATTEGDGRRLDNNVSYLGVKDWQERQHSFSRIALLHDWNPTLTGTDKPEVLRAMKVTYDFFETLGVKPLLGRGFAREEDRPGEATVVVLSHGFWKERFAGRGEALGSTMLFDQRRYQVVGVLPENFHGEAFSESRRPPQVWVPLGYDASLPNACRSCQHLHSVARVNDGVTLAEARTEMRSIASQLDREFPNDYAHDLGIVVTPLRSHVIQDVRGALWLLLGATGLVLLIACANVANLLLARSSARHREMALRATLGASRVRLARQLLTESTLLTLVSGACGALLAAEVVRALVLWGPRNLPRLGELRVDSGMLVFATTVSLATGVLAGLAPAMQTGRAQPREALQESSRTTSGVQQRQARLMLVTAELALAFVLAVGTGLLVKSLVRVLGVSPGFATRDLHTANVNLIGSRYEKDVQILSFDRQALKRIGALPGVEQVAFVSVLPLSDNYDRCGFNIQDRPMPSEGEAPSVERYFVTPDYFRAMGIPLLQGREFNEADANAAVDSPVAMISESTARQMWPGEHALGKRIQLGGRDPRRPWATIVGIVGDVRQYGLNTELNASAYLLYSQEPSNSFSMVVRSRTPAATLTRTIEREIAALDKNVPMYGRATMEELISVSTTQRRFVAGLMGGFGALALVLSGVGIYGVTAYTVVQRGKEVGIRMALGADRARVVGMIMRGTMVPVGAGLVAGTSIALAGGWVLSSQLFAVRSYDPLVFGVSASVLGMCALLAGWLPAMRAASIDPMEALRTE